MFWPVLVAGGMNFAVVFWDSNVDPLPSMEKCTEALDRFPQRSPQLDAFADQVKGLTEQPAEVTITKLCIDKPPQEFSDALRRGETDDDKL
jgi:hypothetical protein